MCEDHGNQKYVEEGDVAEGNRTSPKGRRSSVSNKSADQPGLGTELALDAVEIGVSSLPRATTSTALVARALNNEGSEEAVSSAAQTSYEVIEASAEDGVSFLDSAGELASGLIDGAVEFVGSILSG